jgi:ABC-type multidrug transport system fused ATPase/permease subunit
VCFFFLYFLGENILFGEKYEKDRYNKVLHASCLNTDLLSMKNGDMTNLGERGVNLSGGQKARVAFARCLYTATTSTTTSTSTTDTLIFLDDPLSAVDVEVGTSMWNRGILGMLKGRTMVIVLSSSTLVYSFID